MDMEEAREKIKSLVKDFSENPKYWDSKPEEDIKFQFIEPLFEALGWERKEISKESRVLKGRADYILKNGNQELLVVEAKKTNVPLTEDEGRQAVSYAYHRKIKFAVLTNFKYLRVYHALSNIKNIDKNLLRVNKDYFRLEFKEFIEKFDILWLLSKESFEKGEINKLLSSKDEKLNKPIDVNILNDLLNIRGWLSKDLKSKKMHLSQEDIDEVVQIFIDRLIFIRSVEDRGLEPANYLKSLESDVRQQRVKLQLFPYILDKFEEFNKKYDSKLFENGLLEKEGAFSDDVLRKVILTLYFGSENNQERYLFDQIPGDLFGSIYEQYLGTILAGTEKRVKLDSLSGKRKKMGIYYTPSYIVDYIVKNTVHEYIKDKSIDEILEVNILDPACGSGSFLIRAFQEVCDVVEEKLKQGERGSKIVFKNYLDRLNLGQKIEILRNCIYGVDLDEKAVELARLNLLLKVLEGENQDTKVSKLPNLTNVKCGNSLIDDPKVSDRAFKWESEFRDVFANGGFDVVVGNPPYVRIQTLDKKDVDYFNKKYVSPEKNYDIYILFIELGYKLLKKEGKLGFILSNKFFTADYGKNIRNFIVEKRGLNKIIDFKDYQIFDNASTYTCLLFLYNEKNEKFSYNTPRGIGKLKMSILDDNSLEESLLILPKKDSAWSFSANNFLEIMNKLNKVELKLKDISSSIFQGMVTGADRFYFVKILGEEKDKLIIKNNLSDKKYLIEKEIVKKLLKGREIREWFVKWEGYSVLYPYNLSGEKPRLIEINEIKEKYPLFFKYLKDYETELKSREENKFKDEKNWYKFGRTQNIDKFKHKKIMTQVLSNSNKFVLDYSGEYYFVGGGNAGGYGIILNDDNKDKYEFITSILNSNLLEFYLKRISTCFRGGYYSYGKRFIETLPIRLPSPAQEKRIISLVEQMLSLQKKYHDEKTIGHEKERLKSQIDAVDYEIDEEVYKLYGITDEEKKIIEGSGK